MPYAFHKVRIAYALFMLNYVKNKLNAYYALRH